MLAYAQECTRRTHTVSCGWTNVHDMLRNEPHLQIQRISTSKPLHAPCSAMRLMDDTRERCNQKTTYIMSCAWDHAHDASGARAVFHSWHFASWFYLVINHGLTSVYIMSHAWDHAHQRMRSRTQDCATRKPTLLYYSCCFDFVCSMIRCDVW